MGVDGKRKYGLQHRQTYLARYDFPSRSYRVELTSWSAGKNTTTRQFRSHVGNELRGYTDPASPFFKTDPSVRPGGGVIDRIEDRVEYPGPELCIGSQNITQTIGKQIQLVDLFHQSVPTVTPEGTIFMSNVLKFPDSFPSKYDMELELDKEHGYLPKRVTYSIDNSIKKVRTVDANFEVSRFFQDRTTGLWVPIDVTFNNKGVFAKRIVVIEESIVLNECPSIDSYRVQFPPDLDVLDEPRRKLLRDGKVVEHLSSTPTPSSNSPRYRFFLLALAILVTSCVVVVLVKRRGLLCLAAIGVASMATGCWRSEKTVSLSRDLEGPIEATLILNKEQHAFLELPEGEKKSVTVNVGAEVKSVFTFPIKNIGKERCTFASSVFSTCGCTLASVFPIDLEPGGTAVIRGELESSPIPGKKTIQLRAIVKEPEFKEVTVLVDATFVGDWSISKTKVVLDGLVGRNVSKNVEIEGYPEVLKKIRYTSSGEIEVQELKTKREELRRFKITGTLRSTAIEYALGTISFQCSSGKPYKNDVNVAGIGRSNSSWSPTMMLLEPGSRGEAELIPGEGDELMSVEASDGIRIERVKDENGAIPTLHFECFCNDQKENQSQLGKVVANLNHNGNPFSMHLRVVLSNKK